MLEFHAAADLIDEALDTGQIGTPVAVRIVAHVEATGAGSALSSERAVQIASRWLDDQPMRVVSTTSGSRAVTSWSWRVKIRTSRPTR